ncbi:[Pyruvate dehydrogenase (acetyl-transferring)] kinase 2, mitochondrial [Teratosphaeria destructans]|uniref:Protein-serine/threonine kinase n=1 Tax=Teratosphaeria destructans TaxID=418781 RepID=A0A9W7VZW9_9PEZI|nr:[Pyruvate dehydrogenase (acetyl-transferring)] kinase 2, mitochondrial [Teratosphaeria destructans]
MLARSTPPKTKTRWSSLLLSLPTAVPVLRASSSAAPPHNRDGTVPPPWRPSDVLDAWVQREARPISLRQLTFFGRTLTEGRLLRSANYVRLELPTRLAHRLRDMQTLPYSALTNPHISHVYELYYHAFEQLRKVAEIQSLSENDHFCNVLQRCLGEHLAVIPRLAMGILEIQTSVPPDACDRFITTLLRSRISRRVIAEQHLALTETFHSPWHFPNAKPTPDAPEDEFVGEIFLKCSAREIIERCTTTISDLIAKAYGPDVKIPRVVLRGHLGTAFPYIPSHLEYIIGELLRNSIQAVVETWDPESSRDPEPAPIEVLICEAAQHIILRVSDQGGGVDREVLPYLWSFAKGPRRQARLQNLAHVPRLAGTLQELKMPAESGSEPSAQATQATKEKFGSSLTSLSSRPPDLRLGMGLPMSKIYAEYWAGSLALHSLEGYGCDAFLEISRLGNRNETLSTRASMDAVLPSFTKEYHSKSYLSIDPQRPELQANDRIVLITGAGTGIGAATAKAFAAAGAKAVVLTGRRLDPLNNVKTELGSNHPAVKAVAYSLDVADAAAVARVLTDVKSTLGPIDTLVNCAAHLSDNSEVTDADISDFWRAFEVNVKGTLILVQQFVKHKSDIDPVYISISSGLAHIPPAVSRVKAPASYPSSKIAQAKLIEHFAQENAGLLRAYSVQPGIIDTALSARGLEMADDIAAARASLPWDEGIRGVKTTVDLPAHFALWLSSPEGKSIPTGRYLWANWDVDELQQRSQELRDNPAVLNLGLNGWPPRQT